MKAKIIVISGLTCSGKTTLINELTKYLDKSKIISFDDYDIDQLPSAPPIGLPLSSVVNQYDISSIINAINLNMGKYKYLLLDYPFGNRHKDLAKLIDLTVYNQLPFDIMLARQVIRDFSNSDTFEIIDWMKTYIYSARKIFKANNDYVAETADLVLDGTLPLSDRIETIVNKLLK